MNKDDPDFDVEELPELLGDGTRWIVRPNVRVLGVLKNGDTLPKSVTQLFRYMYVTARNRLGEKECRLLEKFE